MTPRNWAEKEGNRIARDMSLKEATYITIARGLQREHQRAVRICKRIGLQDVGKMFDYKHPDYAQGYVKACVDILAALERGRK